MKTIVEITDKDSHYFGYVMEVLETHRDGYIVIIPENIPEYDPKYPELFFAAEEVKVVYK